MGKIISILSIFIALLIVTVFSCKKEIVPLAGLSNKITIRADSITNISYNTAGVYSFLSGGLGNLGGKNITQHGHCWDTLANPQITGSITQLGALKDTGSFTSQLTGLLPNTQYYVKGYIQFNDIVLYSKQDSFTTLCSSPCCGITSFVYDGQTYTTVEIGSQCWMAENLNYGAYVAVTTGGQDLAGTQKYCQNLSGVNDPACPMGGLYEWAEMMDGSVSCNGTGAPPNDKCVTVVQGICPTGWHIPSHYEWTTLEKNVGSNPGAFPYDITTIGYLGTDEGGNLKQTGATLWVSPNTGATNSSGFTALPGGYSWSGSFFAVGADGFWWSATESSSTNAWYRVLRSTEARSYRDYNYGDKLYGFSVRCIQD